MNRLTTEWKNYLTERGVTEEVADARGYRVVHSGKPTGPEYAATYKFPDSAGGLLIPLCPLIGGDQRYQLRYLPGTEPKDAKGKPTKFISPKGQPNCLATSPLTLDLLRQRKQVIFIGEGVTRVDALAGYKIPAVGLSGISGWKGRNDWGGTTVLPDWDMLNIKGSRFIIGPDGDVTENPDVYRMTKRLAGMLKGRGAASVGVLTLPDGAGLDDWIAEHGFETQPELSKALIEHVVDIETMREPNRKIPNIRIDWVSRAAEIPAARRLIDAHAERLLVVENSETGRLRLLVMDDVGIWRGGLSTLYRMINDTELELGQEAFESYRNNTIDNGTFGSVSRWLKATNNDKGRQAILASVTGVGGAGWKWPTGVERCTEDEIDAWTEFLGCANGVVDLKAGLVLSPSEGRTKLVTLTTGVEYDPTVRAVDIETLFSRLDPKELRWFFQAMGWGLRGQPSGRGYLLLGEERGGKSSVLAAIRGSLGDYSDALPEGVLTQDPKSNSGPRPELEPFTRLRIGTDSDLPPRVPISRSTFNRVTSGNDPFRGRKLYHDYGVGRRSVCTLLLSANYGETPYFRTGADRAIYDRLRILPYPGTIPVADRDLDLERRVEFEMESRRAMLAKLIDAGIDRTGPPEDTPSVSTERERFRVAELGASGSWLLSHVVVTNDPADRFHANTLWVSIVQAAMREDAHAPKDGAKKETVWERDRTWVMEQVKKLHKLDAQKKVRVEGDSAKGWDGVILLPCGSDCQTCSRPEEELDVDESETADAPAPTEPTEMANAPAEPWESPVVAGCPHCHKPVNRMPPYLCLRCGTLALYRYPSSAPTVESCPSCDPKEIVGPHAAAPYQCVGCGARTRTPQEPKDNRGLVVRERPEKEVVAPTDCRQPGCSETVEGLAVHCERCESHKNLATLDEWAEWVAAGSTCPRGCGQPDQTNGRQRTLEIGGAPRHD